MKNIPSIVIICSKGHWRNGALTEKNELQFAIEILEKTGVKVLSVEVEDVAQLTKVLDNIPKNTLVWGNAYYVGQGSESVWLNDFIKDKGLPFFGSGAQTLRALLQKDICQSFLKEAAFPIPKFTIITAADTSYIPSLIAKSGIDFPMVLKPTAESGSVGVVMAKNMKEAVAKTRQIIADFPLSHVIVEEFLPSDDITCGFLKLGDEILLLPTYYLVKSTSGKEHILDREQRLRKWDDVDKMQPVITDESILDQLKTHIPKIVKAFDIQDFTRLDGRLDKNGELRFFDINGFPALDFPDSVLNKQCFSCFPDYSQEEVFVSLLHTIIQNAFMRYGMTVPKLMKEHNLFTMKSDWVIRFSE